MCLIERYPAENIVVCYGDIKVLGGVMRLLLGMLLSLKAGPALGDCYVLPDGDDRTVCQARERD